jgi:hypothetical protein
MTLRPSFRAVLLGGVVALAGGTTHRALHQETVATEAGRGEPATPWLRLIAVGDTGEGNDTQRRVASVMSATCKAKTCNAILMLGDNFYPSGVQDTSDPQWLTAFEDIYDLPGLIGLPFYAILGNHDYGATSTGSKNAQLAYARLPVGKAAGQRPSDKWCMPAGHYDIRLGNVHLFALDTQDISEAQARDMAARVAQSTATWKVVLGHHPRFSSGAHEPTTELIGQLGMFALIDPVICAGADLYLAGHDHHLELIAPGRHPRCPGVAFAISGAGSKVRRSTSLADPQQRFYTDETAGFLVVEATEQGLRLEFISESTHTLGTFILAKAGPTLVRLQPGRGDER